MTNPPQPPLNKPMNYLITGAARGIGRSLTRSLIARGDRVFLLDNNVPELQHTLSLLSQAPEDATAAQHKPKDSGDGLSSTTKRFSHAICNLEDRSSIRAAVDQASKFFDGKLDVLINNAMALPHVWSPAGTGMEDSLPSSTSTSSATSSSGTVSASPDDSDEAIMKQWDAKIAVGLTAPFYLSRLTVPLLKRASAGSTSSQPGSIVNISSTRATQAELDHEGYSAAKAGLVGLTQSLAVSLGQRYRIRVNAILPGWIHVGDESAEADEQGLKWEDGLTEEDHKWHPAGRVGRGEDILKAVDYVVGNEFVTGQEIVVDGGVGRKMVYPE